MIRVPRLFSSLVVLLWALAQSIVAAAEPLHDQIDRLIAEKFSQDTPAPRTDDAAFLRRVTLDLEGTIPTAEETRAFLADVDPEKRSKRIDQLLAAPSYAARMENFFHVMLMERRGDHPEWSTFLKAGFEKNRPWDQMARDILNPPNDEETRRGAAFFHTKRLEKYGENPTDYSGLTRDVGRMFLGIDLQCAECHDHLFVEDYKQVDFQGLYFVFKNLAIGKEKFPAVTQSAMTEKLDFISVFDPTQMQTGPRIPFGKEIAIPELPKVEPDKKKDKTPVVPGFDPLSLIAAEMTAADNEKFNKNIVNRLWFAMMGRGLVMPLDLFHSENPPSHPELLDLLAKEFVAHRYDIKWFLRELALTETYQRTSVLPEGVDKTPQPERYLVANEKRMSAEQLLASFLVATGNAERLGKLGAEGTPNADYAKLETSFRNAFANEVREPEVEFNATVKGALFFLNDETVRELLKPQPGNLFDRLSKIDDPLRTVEELFLNIFSRPPTDEERAAVLAYLEKNADRKDVAIGHVAWSMLSSIEFCVNH